jgi:hypothetical protein
VDDDPWYKFTATSTTATIEVHGGGDYDAVVDLRSGACNGTNIACADATPEGERKFINADGPQRGTRHYVSCSSITRRLHPVVHHLCIRPWATDQR